MRKLILIAHTSLDGFVANPNGGLDWFDASEENLQFVFEISKEGDAALLGRLSYELINGWWPTAADRPNATKGEIAYSNWYNAATKIVVSKTLSGSDLENTIVISENISDEMSKMKRQPGNDIIIFGSPSVFQSLIQYDLIDVYWIFVNPIIFGQGIPLFADIKNKTNLKLISVKQFTNGEVALNYISE
jgi:dihydrofolate reductase